MMWSRAALKDRIKLKIPWYKNKKEEAKKISYFKEDLKEVCA